ncbi:MAG: hypothetical protein JNM76_03525 [Betaproteobacteria bacterium]|nr:hypothetical protein [Betaproteobacteria bacterium]
MSHLALRSLAAPAVARQVYLLEPHPGTLCRVLDLYAARGIAMRTVKYEHAAPQTMMLTITADADHELLRILVAKAGAQVGVIEAAIG